MLKAFTLELFHYTQGRQTLINALNNYRAAVAPNFGRAIYYGVHRAMATMTREANRFYNLDLISANIITFTTGQDNQSAGLSLFNPIENSPQNTVEDYISFVRNQFYTRRIAGVDITGFSLGVRDPTITEAMFNRDLEGTANPVSNANALANFAEVGQVFRDIAENLATTTTNVTTDFNMRTPMHGNDVRVRMTFDINGNNLNTLTMTPEEISQQAANSSRFIEGTLRFSGGAASLINIAYGPGITSAAGTGPLSGTVLPGNNLVFRFNNLTENGEAMRIDQVPSNLQLQWTRADTATLWSWDNHYQPADDVDINTDVHRSSAIVYLVLDANATMSESNINDIRTAAIQLINILFEQQQGGSTGGGNNPGGGTGSVRVVNNSVFDNDPITVGLIRASDELISTTPTINNGQEFTFTNVPTGEDLLLFGVDIFGNGVYTNPFMLTPGQTITVTFNGWSWEFTP